MHIKETSPQIYLEGLYTRLKKRLQRPTTRADHTEPSYYNSKQNNLLTDVSYEKDSNNNYILTSSEKALAKALYESTGPKATKADIINILKLLQSSVKDPLNGYKHSIFDLLNSEYDPLVYLYKDTYNTANNAHKKLVDQISLFYHRGNK